MDNVNKKVGVQGDYQKYRDPDHGVQYQLTNSSVELNVNCLLCQMKIDKVFLVSSMIIFNQQPKVLPCLVIFVRLPF